MVSNLRYSEYGKLSLINPTKYIAWLALLYLFLGCWNRVHRLRDTCYQGSESIYNKRKRYSISYTGSNDSKRKLREARESRDEPNSKESDAVKKL